MSSYKSPSVNHDVYWRILMEQSFTAHMPFLTATKAFRLEDARALFNSVTHTISTLQLLL